MNLRLPVVVTVVAVAVAAAGYRTFHREATIAPASDGIAASFTSAAPEPSGPVVGRTRSFPRASRATDRVTVYVAGDVARAGVYTLPSSARAVDALKAAGGASGSADLVAVNLAEPLADGEEIVVPAHGAEPAADTAATVRPARRSHAKQRTHGKKRHRKHRTHRTTGAVTTADSDTADPTADATADAPVAVVDLNSADENELETLPGIGASLAGRIVAFREVNGPYVSADDLLDVGGMTQSRLDAIVPYVTTR